MNRLKIVIIAILIVFVVSACGTKNLPATPVTTMAVQSPAEPGNPYPIQGTSATQSVDNSSTGDPSSQESAYPDPSNANTQAQGLNPDFFVNELTESKPSSGMAVITGQLVSTEGSDKPYITNLYLASVKLDDDPNRPPEVNFSTKSSLHAIQELSTGRFMYKDVNPGKYALVVWSPGGSFFLTNADGSTFVADVKTDQILDLGVITIK